MAIRRRKGSPHWQYDFTAQGRRFRGSTETPDRETAKAVEAVLRKDAILGIISGRKPRLTLDDAFGRYWLEVAEGKPSARNIRYMARNLLARLGPGTTLDALGDAALADYVAHRRGHTYGRKARIPLSPGSINFELTLLRAVMNRARRAWGVEVAEIDWRAHHLKEPAPRDRVLSADEVDRLLEAAGEHLKAPIKLSLLTGMRLANCIGLDWSQVDMRAAEIALKVKAPTPGGKPHILPMSEAMLVLLVSLGPRAHGPVFTYRGKALSSWRRAWRNALARAGIADFRWHDLRHTAGTWMAREGVRLDVIKDVLGHANIATTIRYISRGTGEKRAALEAVAAQIRHNRPPEAGPRRRKIVLTPRLDRKG